MSRNKENNPLLTAQRHGSIGNLNRNLPSEDFFTDSLIDDSHIPSPIAQKTRPVNPRRAVATTGRAPQATRESGNQSTRSSLAEYTASRTNKHLKPSPTFTRRKSPSPLRTNRLNTPPHSSHGLPLNSPTEFSSPPGGLNESYQRIADEEDLAATERDVDSEEEELVADRHDTLETDVDVNPTEEVTDKGSPEQIRATRDSTPVQSTVHAGKEDFVDDPVESLSERATLDFLQNEMTDRVLAAKLTPHVIDRAKDRARLGRLRQSKIPIDFRNSPKAQENKPNGSQGRNDLASVASRGPINFNDLLAVGTNGIHRAYSDTSAESTPHKRIKAFSRATRAGVHQSVPEESDGSDTPPELQERARLVAFSKATRQKKGDIEEPESPGSQQVPKVIAFSRANGRNRPYGATYELNQDQQTKDEPTESVASTVSEPPPTSLPQSEKNKQAATSFLAKWRKETAERRASKPQEIVNDDSSHIDCAVAAADVPIPSVEKSSTPQETPPRGAWPASIQKQRSIDHIRKWENDFTGLSFQVSESPPVRSRTNLSDSLREREIENLAKQAVTTNRLDEITAKDPTNVLVQKSSRSFSPEERRQTQSEAQTSLTNGQTSGGETIPDTPVVVYRSSSNSTEKSNSKRQISDSENSLDHLQRLARAVSTTPRASPVPPEMIQGTTKDSATQGKDDNLKPQSSRPPPNGVYTSTTSKVTETPKVIGAWTDTILPDTVKEERQPQRLSKYMQTPHINAGAWIDTPLPIENHLPAAPIPMIIDEVTEELTNGDIPKDIVTENNPSNPEEASTENKINPKYQPPGDRPINLPTSALTNVLNEAKQKRLVSRDITDAREDDSLNLGDATIQSFEDLLTDAADITADLTSLIKAGTEDEVFVQKKAERERQGQDEGDSITAEVAFIGHLTSRMERLMSNLHEARKGISRLEHKVAHTPLPDQQSHVEAVIALQDPTQPCAVCGRGDELPHKHAIRTSSRGIPYTTLTLPIPLLFYPRRKSQGQILPRPTPLGWATIAFWTWYILECTLAEIYARPLYAEQYVWPTRPEPEFPLVLPTMMYRWSRLDTLGLAGLVPGLFWGMWRFIVAMGRVVAMALGLSDGFIDDRTSTFGRGGNGGAVASATEAALKVARSFGPGANDAGPDLSMMNDEII